MKIIGSLALVAATLISQPLQAVEKPTGDEVNRVMSYFKDGSEVVLVDSKLCTEIEKSGENKNECKEELPNPIASKASGYLWMNFLVPGSQKPNMLIQFKYKNRVLDSDEVKLSSAFRYRTWKRLQTSKDGDWEVTIEQETEAGYITVGSVKYTVADGEVQ